MASTTATFLKSRVDTPTVNRWSSGFTAVQKYAEKNELPLIGCWSNGDACGNCINFEKTLMTSEFLNWQKTSGCVFWFGCSSDKTTDDKQQGTGSKWCKNSKLTNYPFVRVYWKKGKVDVSKSGNDWTGGGTSGAKKFVEKLKSLLKDFCPECGESSDSGCDGCSECGDCSELEGKVAELQNENACLAAKVDVLETRINEVMDILQKPIDVSSTKGKRGSSRSVRSSSKKAK